MNYYIGTKEVNGKPMTRGDYNTLRGWTTPENEDPNDEGYLVEYLDSPNSNHPDFDNYISWSPKDVFERSYRQPKRMTFGMALECLKIGRHVQREGWNGKGMFVFMQKGYPDGIPANKNTSEALGIEEGTEIKVTPYLMMRAADGTLVTGWLASQTDMLSEDWEVLP